MSVSSYSTTASSNATISGTNIAENCPAGNLNNAIRQMMADIRTELTDAVLTLTAKATVAEIRTALDALEATAAVEAIGALTPAADKVPYYTSASAAALATLTNFARTLLDDADAATARTTLGAEQSAVVSGGATSGKQKIGQLTLTWRDHTVGGGSTVCAYGDGHVYTSWARAWLEGDDNNSDVSVNVSSQTVSGATVRSVTGLSIRLYSIGV